jgi:uncharacterized damage-inducible protein DinB
MLIYSSLNHRLKNQHEIIEVIISKLPEEKISEEIIIGKWSIHDNLAHLAKYQPLFTSRIDSILKNTEPEFESYSAETDQDFGKWREWSTDKLLLRLKDDRRRINDIINNLSWEEINKCGFHRKFGRMTILEWTEFFLLHEAHHIYTIFRLAHQRN